MSLCKSQSWYILGLPNHSEKHTYLKQVAHSQINLEPIRLPESVQIIFWLDSSPTAPISESKLAVYIYEIHIIIGMSILGLVTD